MINYLLREPFRRADKEMTAAHRRVNQVQTQDGKGKTVVAFLFVHFRFVRGCDFGLFFDFVKPKNFTAWKVWAGLMNFENR